MPVNNQSDSPMLFNNQCLTRTCARRNNTQISQKLWPRIFENATGAFATECFKSNVVAAIPPIDAVCILIILRTGWLDRELQVLSLLFAFLVLFQLSNPVL